MSWSLDKILKAARHFHASDVHLIRDVAPVLRINGEIRPIDGEPLDADTLKTIVPIEFVHENERSIVVQQEVMADVRSFRDALVHVLRQDPDVIVIREMRNLETIETALTAAETGHLVLATLHTPDSVQTVQRIYSVFPAEQQNSIVTQIANSLKAIIAQKLLPLASGKGQVLATEICIVTNAIRNHIRDRTVHQIYSEMQTGRKHQMQTMDGAMLDLYQRGEITYDTALTKAREQSHIQHKAGTVNATAK